MTLRYHPVDISEKQRENLEKLAAYLEQLPTGYDHFEMGVYYRGHFEEPRIPKSYSLNECGTVACAVGHGPAAGIRYTPGEEWREYANENFAGYDADLFEWCFSANWTNVDNTPKGAAKRIRIALEKGVPNDAADQLYEGVPLCYAVE